MRKLLALLTAFASPALAQTPAGTINAPIYATGYISQGGGTNVTTKIPAQSNHPTNLNIYLTGAVTGTWSIQLPNPAFEGQVLSFNCGSSASAVAVTSTDGSSLDSSIPTSCNGNSGFVVQFNQRDNTWRNLGSNATTLAGVTVNNNTQLTALPSQITAAVRLGYATAGDAPPLLYTRSNSACSLNAGAGDGGSQVPTSDGKCWIAVFGDKRDIRVFGGKDDGSTDNTAAFNAAIASLPSSGGTIVFPAASTGVYAFTSGIVIGDGSSSAASTKQNIKLEGVPGIAGAAQSVGSAFAGNVPVKFKYTGSGQASVFMYVKGPIVWGMDGISLDCGASFKCDTALFTQHQFQSVIENVKIENFKVKGIREDAFPILPSGVAIGSSNNRWKNVFVTSLNLGTAATGWDIGISSCVIATGCFDVSNNIYEMVEVQVPDIAGGASILLRGADNLTFQRSFTYQLTSGHVGTNAWGVYVLPPTGNFALPAEIAFYNSPLVGGVYGTTDWACNSGGGRVPRVRAGPNDG